MKIADFLSEDNIVIDLRSTDKSTLLKDLASRAATILALEADVASREVEKRDELGSTGIGGGVAIPHARFRDVQKPFGLLARLKSPIEFDAIDGEPVDIVFLLLLPARSQIDQLNALACVARKMRDPEVLSKVRSANHANEIYRAVTG